MSSAAEPTTELTNAPSEVKIDKKPPRSLTPVQEQETLTVIFHADADLFINVTAGSGSVRFKVNAPNLGAASPAWNRLLYSDLRQAHPAGGGDKPWIITFQDDAKALSTLLQIVHYRFDKVPKAPSIDELYEVLALTSKYSCTSLLHPWTGPWTEQLKDFINGPDAAIKNHKVAFIAWELGCVGLFRQVTDLLILTTTVDNDGQLAHPTGIKLQNMVLPFDLLGRIQKIRADTLATVLDNIRTPLDHFSHAKRVDGGYCKVGKDAERCEAMLFGTALPGLIAAGLFPVPQVSGYRGSLLDLKNAIYGIRSHHWEGKNTLPHQAHTGCNLGLRDSVKKVMEAMDSPVDKLYLDHLSARAAISGFDNGTTPRSTLSPAATEYVHKPDTSSDDEIVGVDSNDAKGAALSEPKSHGGHVESMEKTVSPQSDTKEDDDSTKPEDQA